MSFRDTINALKSAENNEGRAKVLTDAGVDLKAFDAKPLFSALEEAAGAATRLSEAEATLVTAEQELKSFVGKPLEVKPLGDAELLILFPDGGVYDDATSYGSTNAERRAAAAAWLTSTDIALCRASGDPEYTIWGQARDALRSYVDPSAPEELRLMASNAIRVLAEDDPHRTSYGRLFGCLDGYTIDVDNARKLFDTASDYWMFGDEDHDVEIYSSEGTYQLTLGETGTQMGCQFHARAEIVRAAALAGFIPTPPELEGKLLPTPPSLLVKEEAPTEASPATEEAAPQAE